MSNIDKNCLKEGRSVSILKKGDVDRSFINNELIQVSLYSEENNEIIEDIWSIFEKELDSIFEPFRNYIINLIGSGSNVEVKRYNHKLGKLYLRIADRLRKIGLMEYYDKKHLDLLLNALLLIYLCYSMHHLLTCYVAIP